MEYVFVVNRIKKVIDSCNTKEQLDVAYKYCSMLVGRWNGNQDGVSLNSGFFREMHMRDHVDTLISLKRKII